MSIGWTPCSARTDFPEHLTAGHRVVQSDAIRLSPAQRRLLQNIQAGGRVEIGLNHLLKQTRDRRVLGSQRHIHTPAAHQTNRSVHPGKTGDFRQSTALFLRYDLR